MKYDFVNPPSRKGSDCYKYDYVKGDLPMWVADMDFQTAPEIREALIKRVEHGIFGYSIVPEAWNAAYVSFYKDLFNWEINPKDLVFALGVVPILSSSVRALTKAGDNVVIMPPVYNIFYNSIINNKRNPLEVPLVEKEGRYYLDFGAIESAFSRPETSLCIFCNPGNPSARIWSKEEINVLASLARKHNVIVLSDEIHGPITRPGTPYVPFLNAKEDNKDVAFAAISPTKAFNLAGIHTAAMVCPNKEIREKVERQLNTDEVAEPNAFSCVAAISAFNEGREWLKQCNELLFSNRDYAFKFIKENLPSLRAYEGDATYLLWVDCSNVDKEEKRLLTYLEEKCGLVFNGGSHYGKGGEGHFRINLACPRAKLEEGLKRLKQGLEDYAL